MSDTLTRREFIKAAAMLGAGAATLSVTGCAGNQDGGDQAVATPSSSYEGGAEMGARALVGYATRTGSTVGVAEAIGETLAARGFDVDVKPLRERPALDGYDAVVLGSAVNGGAWLPEALAYVEANRDKLGAVPMAAFCVHSMNLGDDAKSCAKRLAYLDGVRKLARPADEGFFAGVGPTAEDSSFIARWAFKAFGGGIEGDARDFDAIRAWASGVRIGDEARA